MLVKNSNEVIENSTSISKLRALFESTEYEYIKRHEMITYISEGDIDEISVYLKRIPDIENWVLDVYGKSENMNKIALIAPVISVYEKATEIVEREQVLRDEIKKIISEIEV